MSHQYKMPENQAAQQETQDFLDGKVHCYELVDVDWSNYPTCQTSQVLDRVFAVDEQDAANKFRAKGYRYFYIRLKDSPILRELNTMPLVTDSRFHTIP